MLRNLVRAVFTIVGAMIGYGVFLLAKYLIEFSGHEFYLQSELENICKSSRNICRGLYS